MNDIALPLDITTLADRFYAAEYETGYIGKWHLASTGTRYAKSENRPGQREPVDVRTRPVPPERRGGYRDLDGWDTPASELYVEDHLYDLVADPHERVNLASDSRHQVTRTALSERLRRLMRTAGEGECSIAPQSISPNPVS